MTQEKRQQLSTEQTPPAIKPGQIKKFKLINAGAIDPVTNAPAYNAGATFAGISTVWDRAKNQLVMIKNITGIEITVDKDGKEIHKEIVSPVEFDANGMCYVDHKKPETYLWLARDDRNSSNPFRDKNKEAEWYEVLEVNIREKEQFKNNLEFEAMSLVKLGDIKKVLAIGKTLAEKKILVGVNLSGSPTDVRYEIERICKIHPAEVIRAAREKLPIIKLDIQDAVNYGDIEYQHDGNMWVWTKKYGEEKNILKVDLGFDPLEVLAKHLFEEEEAMDKKKKEERTETQYQKIKNTLKELSIESV